MNIIIEEKIPINHIAKKHLEKYSGIESMKVNNMVLITICLYCILSRFEYSLILIVNFQKKSGKELTEEDKQLIENHVEFQKQYALLLKKVIIDNLDVEEHPWTQYRVNRESSFQKSDEQPYKPRYYKRKPRRFTKYVVRM